MEMTGEQIIPVPQTEVWRALNDPEVLKACIAGCETIEKVSDNEYRVVMVASVGPVKAKFNGKLVLSDLNPPSSYSIAFEGSGGAAGFGKGGAQVSLKPEGDGTRLTYTAKASVGGKLAQVGSRLIDGVARKMADDFFVAFKEKVAPGSASTPATDPHPATSAQPSSGAQSAAGARPAASEHSSAEHSGIHPMWIVAGTIAVMLIVSLLLGKPNYL